MPQAQAMADEEKLAASGRKGHSRSTGSLPAFQRLTKTMNLTKRQVKSVRQQIKPGNRGIAGLSPGKVTKVFNQSIKQNIAKKQEEGLPIARYDPELRRAYLENADGTREYV